MEVNHINLIEKELFVGLKEKMAARVIIQRVPNQIKEGRIRSKRAKNGAKSKEYTLWAGINVYLTNTTNEALPAEQAIKLYRARSNWFLKHGKVTTK